MSVLRTGLVAGRCIFVRHANMSNMFDNATESLHVATPRTGVFETFFVRKHFETRTNTPAHAKMTTDNWLPLWFLQ